MTQFSNEWITKLDDGSEITTYVHYIDHPGVNGGEPMVSAAVVTDLVTEYATGVPTTRFQRPGALNKGRVTGFIVSEPYHGQADWITVSAKTLKDAVDAFGSALARRTVDRERRIVA